MSTSFKSATASGRMQAIDNYFDFIKGEPQPTTATGSSKTTKEWIRAPEVPTLRGLALFLKLKNLEDLELSEQKKRYRKALRYARLKVEAAYEQQLFEKPTGAIFALKSMGCTDKPKSASVTNKTLKIEIINSGPLPAKSEKEVSL